MKHSPGQSKRPHRRAWAVVGVIAGASLLLYLLLGWLVAPGVIRDQVTERLSTMTGRAVTVGDVRVNPLRLSSTVEDFRMAGAPGVGDAETEDLLSVRRIHVQVAARSIFRFAPVINLVRVEEPQLRLMRKADGQLSIADILDRLEEDTEEPEEVARTIDWAMRRLELEGGRVMVADHAVSPVFEYTVSAIELTAEDIGTLGDEPGSARMAAQVPEDGKLEWEGNIAIEPLEVGGRLATDLPLAPFQPYLLALAELAIGPTRLQSELAFAFHAEPETEEETFTVTEGGVTLSALSLRTADAESAFIELEEVRAAGLEVRLDERFMAVDQVTVRNGGFVLERDAAGGFWFMDLANGAGETEETAEPGWTARIEEIQVENFLAGYRDHGFPNLLEMAVTIEALNAGPVSNQPDTPVTFSLIGAAGDEDGEFALAGAVTPTPLSGEIDLRVEALSLRAFAGVIGAFTSIETLTGKVHADGTLAMGESETTGDALPAMRFEGQVALSELQMAEAENEPPLVNIPEITLDALEVVFPAREVRISALHVQEPQLFMVFENDTLNWLQLFPEPERVQDEGELPDIPSPTFDLRIARITVSDGGLLFEDRSRNPVAVQQVRQAKLEVENFTLYDDETVSVQLSALLQEIATFEANARWNAAHRLQAIDADAALSQFRLPPLSPYSAELTGRPIVSGELNFNLSYTVRDALLEGEQSITMEEFEFGPQIVTDPVINLPVELGAALLRDLDDAIVVEVPVSGDLNDPDFSLWSMILTAITNVAERAVTKPFRILADALEGSDDDSSHVTFEPGQSTLDENNRYKLQVLGLAMREQSELILHVASLLGEGDRAAYAEPLLHDQLRAFQAEQVESDADGFVDFEDEEAYAALLRAFYRTQTGSGDPDEELPDADTIESRLLAEIEVTDADLETLQRARDEAVRDYVRFSGMLFEERVQEWPEDAPPPAVPFGTDQAVVVFEVRRP